MQFGFEQCPYCVNSFGFVYIHGHYQCKRCHQNVMPCCGGEQEIIKDEDQKKSTDSQNASEESSRR
jgi:hypothetical protein